jgi:tRNA(Ile)-lysidine synthase
MALLGLLRDLTHLHQWTLTLWHGDHRWHQHSSQIAADLNQWCHSQGLLLKTEAAPADLPRTEADARDWRYGCLAQLANASGADAVTGHTASDRAETLLQQLSRGCDLAGLGSLRAVRLLDANAPEGAQLRRPLLGFTRHETAKICSDLQLPVWDDPGNQSIDFTRNRIRHEVMPVLQELYPGCSLRLAATANRMAQHSDATRELSQLALQGLKDGCKVRRRELGRLSTAARRVILRAWILQEGATPPAAKILEQLSDRLKIGEPAGRADLRNGWHLTWRDAFIELTHTPIDQKPCTQKHNET